MNTEIRSLSEGEARDEGTWREAYAARLMRTFSPPALQLVRGEGAWVWDSDGRRYLDFLAGIAVDSLGHAHPAVIEAASRQAATLMQASNYFATPPQLALAERLLRLTGADQHGGRVYFANSGTEAIEAAFKLAKRTGRPRVLSLEKSFHGRTLGALSLTGNAGLRAPFEPLVPGVTFIDSTIAALEAALADDVAALIVEPIKGEAGVVPLPDGYLRAARELTARHGALLIVDEIQTGAGRTGTWFEFQAAGIVPDAVVLAKGIGGGVPIGALVAFGAAAELFSPGQHGSTFGGNAFATAIADAVLAEIEQADLVANAAARGAQLRDTILALDHDLVGGVRGKGLMIGVELTREVGHDLVAVALGQGLIINSPREDTIRLVPPLIIGDEEIAAFADRFRDALATVETTIEGGDA